MLIKGLNFSVAPKKIPVEEIVCAIEVSVKWLEQEKAEEIRLDVKSNPPKSIHSREVRSALRALKEDYFRIISPMDKANTMVVMQIKQYK